MHNTAEHTAQSFLRPSRNLLFVSACLPNELGCSGTFEHHQGLPALGPQQQHPGAGCVGRPWCSCGPLPAEHPPCCQAVTTASTRTPEWEADA